MIRDYTKREDGNGVRVETIQTDRELGEVKATFPHGRRFMVYELSDFGRTVTYKSITDEQAKEMLSPTPKPAPAASKWDALSDADLKDLCPRMGVKYDAKAFDRAAVIAELVAKSK